jgi:aspartate aminotransferase
LGGENKSQPVLLLSDPSYVNHFAIFKEAGFALQQFRYYDRRSNRLDLQGMLEDLKAAPKGSVLLLHASAHNPTGVDPSQEEWRQISKVAKERELVCFFDSAYQGFASGDPDRDGWAYRHFLEESHQVLVAQSYSKNFGLYGQRVGALNVATSSTKETTAVLSQLNLVIRPMYSNPPLHGARIVATVFGDSVIRAQWEKDVKTMADRINGARKTLVDTLKQKYSSPHDWSHITNQIGMFAYSGLNKEQVAKLRAKSVYMNYDGRMSISGINSKNVDYLAKAMHEVTTN